MPSVPASLVRSYGSLAAAGVLLPTIMAVVAHLLLSSLAAVLPVLGGTRCSARWPVSLVFVCVRSIPLLDLTYSADNAALFFWIQIVTAGGICAVLRWKGFRLTVPRASPLQTDLSQAEGLQA